MDSTNASQLCLECGLCCNGVIFADGQLQPEDDVERLRSLGLALKRPTKSGEVKFKQPCAAFEGCRCRIYGDRPRYCREFECLLFKHVAEGEVELAAGLKTIRAARRRVDKVKRLLRRLGDTDEDAALSIRFRRVQRRFERGIPDAEAAGDYGQLTLAVHDLHVLLADAFYPG